MLCPLWVTRIIRLRPIPDLRVERLLRQQTRSLEQFPRSLLLVQTTRAQVDFPRSAP